MNKIHILFLILLSFVLRAPFLAHGSLYKDEALYAQTIHEFIHSPSLLPHYLTNVIAWKPILTFYIYSPIVYFLEFFPLPPEVIYRFPSLIFGILSVIIFYYLAKNLYNENLAFFSAMIFAATTLVVKTNSKVLTDTLAVFFILLALLFYIKGEKNTKYFIFGGICAGLAFFTKTILSFIVPFLAISYYFLKKKNILRDKLFLFSLFFPFFAGIFQVLLFYSYGHLDKVLISYFYDFALRERSTSSFQFPIANFVNFLELTFPWIAFTIVGLINTKFTNPEDKFSAVWLALSIFPIIFGFGLTWYFLPVLPAFSIFAGKAILHNTEKIDKFIIVFAGGLLLVSAVLTFSRLLNEDEWAPQKDIGLELTNKSNILILTDYTAGIVFYKFYFEKEPKFDSLRIIWIQDPTKVDENYIKSALYKYDSNFSNFNTVVSNMFFDSRDVKFTYPEPAPRFEYVVTNTNTTYLKYINNYEIIYETKYNYTDNYYIIKLIYH